VREKERFREAEIRGMGERKGREGGRKGGEGLIKQRREMWKGKDER
jgi:hypothetical protein